MEFAEDFQMKKNDTIVCEYLRYLFVERKIKIAAFSNAFLGTQTKHKGTVPLSSTRTVKVPSEAQV